MSQEIINIGASANDGQGDPIRTAFAKTNNNFTQLFGIGASQIIYNGTSNVNLPFLNGNVFISVGGVSNVMVVDPTGANISGKLAVTGNVTGGNLLTGGAISSAGTITGVTVVGDYIQGIITTASQTQITALGTLGSLSVSANVQAGNVRSSGTVSAVGGILAGANVFGTNLKASGLMSVTGSATAGNIFTSGSLSATSNITGGNLLTSGLISATGNINAGNIIANNIGNIAALNLDGNASTILYGNGVFAAAAPSSSYGDSNVTTLLSNLGSNTISTTANVTGGNIIANNIGNIAALNLDGNASTILYGNGVFAPAAASSYGDSNVTTLLSNLGSNTISTTANVTGNYFLGNGSQLTSLPAPVVTQDITSNGAMSIMTYDGVIKYVNYATVEPSSGNIAGGNISATGNITGNYILGNGSQLTGITAAANTGNVTFDNQAVVGTGDQIGAGGLYLAPGNTSVGNLQYLRVRGGDVATHIHFDTGNNAYFDQYFGDDGKYVKLEAAGNVLIGSNDAVGNAAQWTFDTIGNLTVPGGGAVFSIGTGTMGVTANATSGNAYLGLDDTSSAATLYGNAGVQIGTNGNVGWNFQPSGNLTLPDGGLLGTTYGYTALQAGNAGGLLIQNANCYVGVAPDESFTVVAASQVWTFSNANAAATLQCPVVAYAALPSATYAAGLRAFINNSNASSFGQVVDGSGAYTVPVWSDGADWRVG